jgi:hypothetical protein
MGHALVPADAAQLEVPSLPETVGPLRDTPASHAFGGASYQNHPLDLAALGYIEEEYVLRGRARVFDWGRAGSPAILAEGTYATRALIRRPKDATRFNGTVIIEPLNPSADVDLPIMWAQSAAQFMHDGFVWIGISIKPNTIRALKQFNAMRYETLGFPNPRGVAACAANEINPLSQPATVNDETGLAWDVLSQVGALFKSSAGARLIGRPATRLYMTGQSQSAGYARTYATVFARTVAGNDGKPLYDGFLYSGSPPWQVPLNQCRTDLPEGDPRLITPAVGVPVIELFAEGDIGTNVVTRRPDSDRAPDLFRRYEIAGAAHVDPWEIRSFATDEAIKRSGGRPVGESDQSCEPRDVTPSDFPLRYVFDAAWRSLDAWVRERVPPPKADWLQLKPDLKAFVPESAFVLDAVGNAQGGVRSIPVDVPVARWVGAQRGSFRCMFYGYQFKFAPTELKRLYPTHAAYVAKVRARADQLAKERWLTPTDREEILLEGERANVP